MESSIALDRLFRVLPDVPELAPVRQAMLSMSAPDPDRLWASASRYATFDKRVVEIEDLDGVIADARQNLKARLDRLYEGAVRLLGSAAGGDDAAVVQELVRLGEVAESDNDGAAAQACYRLAASLAGALPDRRPVILALRRLARSRLTAGHIVDALALYRSSFDHATAAGLPTDRSVALTGMGNACSFASRWDDALDHYDRALEFAGPDEHRLRAQIRINVAMVARERGEFDRAETSLQEAATAWHLLEDDDRSGWYNFAGRLALSRERWEEAESHFSAALSTVPAAFERAMILDSMAELAIRRGNLDDAERLARQAEQQGLAAASPRALADIYLRLGTLFRSRGDANGITFFEKSLELCRAHGYALLEATVLEEYARFRDELGDADEATAYRLRARGLRDGTAEPVSDAPLL